MKLTRLDRREEKRERLPDGKKPVQHGEKEMGEISFRFDSDFCLSLTSIELFLFLAAPRISIFFNNFYFIRSTWKSNLCKISNDYNSLKSIDIYLLLLDISLV